VKIKKAFVYFISFFSISMMFSVCYFLSYKNALADFNKNAVERNKELILSLEKDGILQITGQQSANNENKEIVNQENNTSKDNENDLVNATDNTSTEVDTIEEETILPTTKYTLQTYNVKTGEMLEEPLPIPSYLVGLNRDDVIEYLSNYMQDLPLNEFEKGLTAFELMLFSKDNIVIRKTYNEDTVVYKYYITAQNGSIVVFYGDRKTVFDYTGISVEDLPQYEIDKLEDGILVKDLDELYAVLENYSS
jgi:hypothetical protein